MKKNILLSLLFAILSIFIVLFAVKTYDYYTILHADDPVDPYLRVLEGQATIVRGSDLAIDMGSGEVYDIAEGDIIITRADSLAQVIWPDRSKTRMGPNTRLTINRMRVATDYSSIEIELAIEKGKIWTNVVRVIYPGSYFRTKLPDGGIIAGVRGTTFDINLDLAYIRSIDHSITLTDNLGHLVSLLPGEAVSSKNILEKIGTGLRDQIWNDLNTLADNTDSLLRSTQIDETLSQFRAHSGNTWNRFVIYILSRFDAFGGLKIIDIIEKNDTTKIIDIPEKTLLAWYQRFQDKKFVQERENIRLVLSKTFSSGTDRKTYLESLARGALWDSVAFTGMTLQSADVLVREYADSLDARIRSVLDALPAKDLESKAKETFRSLIQ